MFACLELRVGSPFPLSQLIASRVIITGVTLSPRSFKGALVARQGDTRIVIARLRQDSSTQHVPLQLSLDRRDKYQLEAEAGDLVLTAVYQFTDYDLQQTIGVEAATLSKEIGKGESKKVNRAQVLDRSNNLRPKSLLFYQQKEQVKVSNRIREIQPSQTQQPSQKLFGQPVQGRQDEKPKIVAEDPATKVVVQRTKQPLPLWQIMVQVEQEQAEGISPE